MGSSWSFGALFPSQEPARIKHKAWRRLRGALPSFCWVHALAHKGAIRLLMSQRTSGLTETFLWALSQLQTGHPVFRLGLRASSASRGGSPHVLDYSPGQQAWRWVVGCLVGALGWTLPVLRLLMACLVKPPQGSAACFHVDVPAEACGQARLDSCLCQAFTAVN